MGWDGAGPSDVELGPSDPGCGMQGAGWVLVRSDAGLGAGIKAGTGMEQW